MPLLILRDASFAACVFGLVAAEFFNVPVFAQVAVRQTDRRIVSSTEVCRTTNTIVTDTQDFGVWNASLDTGIQFCSSPGAPFTGFQTAASQASRISWDGVWATGSTEGFVAGTSQPGPVSSLTIEFDVLGTQSVPIQGALATFGHNFPSETSVSCRLSALIGVPFWEWRIDHGQFNGTRTLTIDESLALAPGLYRLVITATAVGITGGGGAIPRSTATFDVRLGHVRRCVTDVDDGSGRGWADGGVTIDDLLYFLSAYSQGVLDADVDDGTGTGVLDGGVTVDDLLHFLARLQVGC